MYFPCITIKHLFKLLKWFRSKIIWSWKNEQERKRTHFYIFLFSCLQHYEISKGNGIKSQKEALPNLGILRELQFFSLLSSHCFLSFFFFLIALYTCEPVSINILSVEDGPLKEDLRDFWQNVSKEKSPHSDQNHQVPPLRGEFAFKN